ncbi:farnesol dehydrogenase-like isoform X1 [Copidosoma floridanum]|uniref:farnesol dehydrogenase-like isoform X1 n=1 Tax=Copidosoma floridanum TaxID=29053 RepID=UPI0006C9B6E4|nr:farnesol dehydrogenase-like isoform X1 [Copidosoma floridanum]
MERWSGKVAVVTGASSGIGLATAKALVQHGMTVIGLARRVDKMENEMKAVKGAGKFFAKSCDITKEADVIQAFEWIEKNCQTVHLLVNNAGTMKCATIEEVKTEDMVNIINVNIMGLLHCTRQALHLMKKNGHEAHIININSLAGHKIYDLDESVNVYPATKFAVRAISETLANELKGKSNKIRVTNLSPGAVRTEIFEVSQLKPETIANFLYLEPEDVVSMILYAISVPPHVQINELTINARGAFYEKKA